MGVGATLELVRVYRARSGETVSEAMCRRAEIVTLDTDDLVRVVTRCQTTLTSSEVACLKTAVPRIPRGAGADVVLAPGGRVFVEVHGSVEVRATGI